MKSYQRFYNTVGILAGTATLALAGRTSAATTGTSFLSKFAIGTSPSGNLNATSNTETTINGLVTLITNYVLAFGGFLAFLFLIWNGIRYITSNGDPKKAETARGGIINSIIGIVIIVAAYSIIKFGVGLGTTISTEVK